MSLRDPRFQDGLDNLLYRALRALVGEQEPPDHVWPRIKARLEADETPSPRLRLSWLAPALQAILVLVLVMLGGVSLWQMQTAPRNVFRGPSAELSAPTVATAVDEQLLPMEASAFQDEMELRLLRMRVKHPPKRQVRPKSETRPPGEVATDIPPHPTSPEGRLLRSERIPSPISKKERRPLTGGPHRW